MTVEKLLDAAINYVSEREIDRWESKDTDPDYFYTRGIEIAAMTDLISYLQDYVDEFNYNLELSNKGKER